MKATIWHNPACGTSRKTLAILENLSRVEVTVVEYLKAPPTAEKLAQLYRDAGITPQQGLRLRGTDAVERGLPDADDQAVLAAMVSFLFLDGQFTALEDLGGADRPDLVDAPQLEVTLDPLGRGEKMIDPQV